MERYWITQKTRVTTFRKFSRDPCPTFLCGTVFPTKKDLQRDERNLAPGSPRRSTKGHSLCLPRRTNRRRCGIQQDARQRASKVLAAKASQVGSKLPETLPGMPTTGDVAHQVSWATWLPNLAAHKLFQQTRTNLRRLLPLSATRNRWTIVAMD